MIELTLRGTSSDGDYLLFVDEDDTQYRVQLSDDVIEAARKPPELEVVEDAQKRILSPGDIQTLLREGLSAGEIAQQTGTAVERVRRYETPIQAERDHIIRTAAGTRVGSQLDAPTMGDLVMDRLAEAGIDTETLEWRAMRPRRGHWKVSVLYSQDGVTHSATWQLGSAGAITATNDEARALTETRREEAKPVRALFVPVSEAAAAERTSEPPAGPSRDAERPRLDDAKRTSHQAPQTPHTGYPLDPMARETERLVEQLNSMRGKKQPILEDFGGNADTEPFEIPVEMTTGADDAQLTMPITGPNPPTLVEVTGESPHLDGTYEDVPADADQVVTGQVEADQPGTDTAAESPVRLDDSPEGQGGLDFAVEGQTEMELGIEAEAQEDVKKARRRGRQPIPSWDEIVFGARGD